MLNLVLIRTRLILPSVYNNRHWSIIGVCVYYDLYAGGTYKNSCPASVLLQVERVGEELAVEGPRLDEEPVPLVFEQDVQVLDLIVLAHEVKVVVCGQVVRLAQLKIDR